MIKPIKKQPTQVLEVSGTSTHGFREEAQALKQTLAHASGRGHLHHSDLRMRSSKRTCPGNFTGFMKDFLGDSWKDVLRSLHGKQKLLRPSHGIFCWDLRRCVTEIPSLSNPHSRKTHSVATKTQNETHSADPFWAPRALACASSRATTTPSEAGTCRCRLQKRTVHCHAPLKAVAFQVTNMAVENGPWKGYFPLEKLWFSTSMSTSGSVGTWCLMLVTSATRAWKNLGDLGSGGKALAEAS